ncbi:MAG: SDR family oxidoreductase [Cyclobacteriaceae bacterium]|nr:SDR family oxidoreductase [Cyclobacteriaceae bacterium]
MKGKVCLITGSSTGIGFETALALARKGATVLTVARNSEKVKQAVEDLIEESGNENIDGFDIDLSSQKYIRKRAGEIVKKYPVIDVLVNNAGTWYSRLTYTEDNIEMQFAVNHLAYFLFTQELLPSLVRSDDPRIINVASNSHFHGKMHFNDINLTKKYHGLRAYAQSKLANVLFTYEFERRKTISKLSVYCVQPGLVKTNIGLKHTVSFHGLAWKIRRLSGVTPAEGAETSIYLASSEEVRGISGKYWDKMKIKKSSKGSMMKEDAARLWLLSERLCDIDDYFEIIADETE